MLTRNSLLGQPPIGIPDRQEPVAARRRYQSRLQGLATAAIGRAFAPLLRALPRLAAAALITQAGGAARMDASPIDEAADMARGAGAAFGRRFEEEVGAEARRAAGNVSAHTKSQLRRQLDTVPRPGFAEIRLTDSPRLRPLIDGFVAENVALIRGISPRLQSDVQALVVSGLTNGTPAARLAEQIGDRLRISADRAGMIAVDQIGKLDGQLSAQRTQDLGITHFFWRSSNDERVRGNPDGKYPKARPSHWERNGVRFSYAEPPTGRNGERELPGTPINCRCWQEPDFSTIGADTSEEGGEQEAQEAAEPARAAPTIGIEELEADAARMLAEVEAMLAAEARPPPEPAPPPIEAQASMLDAQLDAMPDDVVDAALRRRRKRARRRRAQFAAP